MCCQTKKGRCSPKTAFNYHLNRAAQKNFQSVHHGRPYLDHHHELFGSIPLCLYLDNYVHYPHQPIGCIIALRAHSSRSWWHFYLTRRPTCSKGGNHLEAYPSTVYARVTFYLGGASRYPGWSLGRFFTEQPLTMF